MILFLHNRYRTTGGEERAVEDFAWLVREHLGEDAEVIERDSATLGRGRAARGLLRGGLDPDDVGAAVRRTGARIVHAHNLNPAFGWRALAAARAAGAKTVLHLHNYRLVCAVGTCINSRGEDCIRCQGRNTAPGVRLNCRGDLAEASAYGVALARWQRRVVEYADAVVAPSNAAVGRLMALRAPLVGPLAPDRAVARFVAYEPARVIPHPIRDFAERSQAASGEHVLVASRLAREKDIDTAIAACRAAALPLVVAGDGPLGAQLRAQAGDGVTFLGRVADERLAGLRVRARAAIVPSRAHETFGLSAFEAMAAGVPVVASAVGALAELGDDVALVPPLDADAMAKALQQVAGDEERGNHAIAAARHRAGPETVALELERLYAELAA